MKKYFSLRFYLDTLIRLKAYIIVAAAIFAGLTAFGNIGNLIYYITILFEGTKPVVTGRYDLLGICSSLPALTYIAVPLLTASAFSFLTKRSESDFYEALPIGREAMLVSGMLAVISAAAAIITVSSVVGLAMISPCIGKTLSYDFLRGLLQALGLLLSAVLAVVGTAVAVSVTGTANNIYLTAMVLLAVPRMVLALVNNSVQATDDSFVQGHIIPLFDNNYNILTAFLLGNDKVVLNPLAYLYTVVLIAAYALLALFLFKKRKSETATHPFSSAIARHFVSVAASAYVAMLGVYLICLDKWLVVISIFLFVLSVALFFVFELIAGRREKTFVSTLKAFPFLFIAMGVLAGTVLTSSSVMKTYSPSEQKIESVSLNTEISDNNFGFVNYDEYVLLNSENVELTDENSKKIVAEALKRGHITDNTETYISISLKIDSGMVHYRNVWLTSEEHRAIISALAENEGYKSLWMNIAEDAVEPVIYGTVDIEGEAALRVLRAMQDEIKEIGFEKWYQIFYSSESATYASISYGVYHGNDYYTTTQAITDALPKTFLVYQEELKLAFETQYNGLKQALTDAASGDGEALNLDLSFFGTDYYDIYAYITNDEESRKIVDGLFSVVSSEPLDFENERATVSVTVYGDGIFSDTYYIDLIVPEDKLEEAIEYFKTYATKY